MKIADFFVSLGLDVDSAKFAEGELAAKAVEKALEGLKIAAEKAFEGIKEIIFGTAEAGHHIQELSERTGVNAEQLQRMAYGASLSGVSMDDLAIAMNHLAKTGVKDVQGEMLRLSDRLHDMPVGGARAALAMEKFGRAGGRLVPWLIKGREEIQRLGDEAEAMGIIMSKDALETTSQFQESLMGLRASVQGVAYTIGVPLLKALKPVIDGLRHWVMGNRKVIATRMEKFVQNLTVAGEFLWNHFLQPLGRVLEILIDRFDKIGPILGIVGAAFALMWLEALAPALLVAAAIGAVILIVEDLWTYMEGGESVIGDVIESAKGALPGLFTDWLAATKEFFSEFGRDLGYSLQEGKLIFVNWWYDIKDWGIKIFSELVDWIIEKARTIGPAVLNGIGSGAAALANAVAPGSGAVIGATNALFGGGASPAASSAASAGTGNTVVAPSITSPVTINAYGGQDPKAIADEVLENHRRLLKTMMGEAVEAVKGG